MATNERALCELDCSNVVKEWPAWKSEFMMYMRATGKAKESEPTKIAIFLWLIGRQAREIYNTLFPNDGSENGILGEEIVVPAANENVDANDAAAVAAAAIAAAAAAAALENQRKLSDVLLAFDRYCIPKKNTTMESFQFNNILQKENQPFAEFETELRKQIRFCEFNSRCACGNLLTYEDRMLKDRIIIGVNDKKLQLKLLDGNNESLQNIIDSCKTMQTKVFWMQRNRR